MICAITHLLTAHQWRNQSAPLLTGALREKANGASAAISLFPTAHQWRNSRQKAGEVLADRIEMMPPTGGGINLLP